jgi:hypothetical protein
MKKISWMAFAIFCGVISTQSKAQQGLESIIVEKYYVADAADSADAAENGAVYPLRAGMITYRVYADLLPNYSVIQMFGAPGHPLEINTTTAFFNDPNYGVPYYQGTSINNTRKNTQMIDSYLTIGAVANGNPGLMGVLKEEDTDGTIGNLQGLLVNNVVPMTYAITGTEGRDGLMPGVPTALNVLGISGELDILDQTAGDSIVINNGAIAALGGIVGVTAENRVMLGQFTTDGVFSFKLNIQLETPQVGGSENYVAEDPSATEFTDSTLIYVSESDVIVDTTDTSTVAIHEIMSVNDWTAAAYPNPFNNEVILLNNSLSMTAMQIEVVDVLGQRVLIDRFYGNQIRIQTSAWSNGVYMVHLKQSGKSRVLRLVKS